MASYANPVCPQGCGFFCDLERRALCLQEKRNCNFKLISSLNMGSSPGQRSLRGQVARRESKEQSPRDLAQCGAIELSTGRMHASPPVQIVMVSNAKAAGSCVKRFGNGWNGSNRGDKDVAHKPKRWLMTQWCNGRLPKVAVRSAFAVFNLKHV